MSRHFNENSLSYQKRTSPAKERHATQAEWDAIIGKLRRAGKDEAAEALLAGGDVSFKQDGIELMPPLGSGVGVRSVRFTEPVVTRGVDTGHRATTPPSDGRFASTHEVREIGDGHFYDPSIEGDVYVPRLSRLGMALAGGPPQAREALRERSDEPDLTRPGRTF